MQLPPAQHTTMWRLPYQRNEPQNTTTSGNDCSISLPFGVIVSDGFTCDENSEGWNGHSYISQACSPDDSPLELSAVIGEVDSSTYSMDYTFASPRSSFSIQGEPLSLQQTMHADSLAHHVDGRSTNSSFIDDQNGNCITSTVPQKHNYALFHRSAIDRSMPTALLVSGLRADMTEGSLSHAFECCAMIEGPPHGPRPGSLVRSFIFRSPQTFKSSLGLGVVEFETSADATAARRNMCAIIQESVSDSSISLPFLEIDFCPSSITPHIELSESSSGNHDLYHGQHFYNSELILGPGSSPASSWAQVAHCQPGNAPSSSHSNISPTPYVGSFASSAGDTENSLGGEYTPVSDDKLLFPNATELPHHNTSPLISQPSRIVELETQMGYENYDSSTSFNLNEISMPSSQALAPYSIAAYPTPLSPNLGFEATPVEATPVPQSKPNALSPNRTTATENASSLSVYDLSIPSSSYVDSGNAGTDTKTTLPCTPAEDQVPLQATNEVHAVIGINDKDLTSLSSFSHTSPREPAIMSRSVDKHSASEDVDSTVKDNSGGEQPKDGYPALPNIASENTNYPMAGVGMPQALPTAEPTQTCRDSILIHGGEISFITAPETHKAPINTNNARASDYASQPSTELTQTSFLNEAQHLEIIRPNASSGNAVNLTHRSEPPFAVTRVRAKRISKASRPRSTVIKPKLAPKPSSPQLPSVAPITSVPQGGDAYIEPERPIGFVSNFDPKQTYIYKADDDDSYLCHLCEACLATENDVKEHINGPIHTILSQDIPFIRDGHQRLSQYEIDPDETFQPRYRTISRNKRKEAAKARKREREAQQLSEESSKANDEQPSNNLTTVLQTAPTTSQPVETPIVGKNPVKGKLPTKSSMKKAGITKRQNNQNRVAFARVDERLQNGELDLDTVREQFRTSDVSQLNSEAPQPKRSRTYTERARAEYLKRMERKAEEKRREAANKDSHRGAQIIL